MTHVRGSGAALAGVCADGGGRAGRRDASDDGDGQSDGDHHRRRSLGWHGNGARGRTCADLQQNNAAVPQPLSGGEFLVLTGVRNRDVAPVAKFKVEADGRFQVTLQPGSYCVIEASRRIGTGKSPGAMYVDPQCAAEQAARCDATWTVSGPQDVSFTLSRAQGGPPACWIGPSPPSAPRH
jgi:hypothetical protein